MKLKTFTLIGILLCILLSSCGHKSNNEQAVRYVKVSSVYSYGLNSKLSYPGKIKANQEANLAFRISGPISKIRVEEGQYVKKGDVLAEMDPRDYRIQLNATQAEYLKIKGEAERVIELYKKGSVTKNEYEKAKYGLEQITAKYNAHTNALEDTKLRAPYNGYIQHINFIANETVSAGMPIINMINNSALEVEVNIPSKDYIRRDQFKKFTCSVDIYPDKEYPLELIGITQKANMNQLHTLKLIFKDKNSDKMPTPGMSTTVDIALNDNPDNLYAINNSSIFTKEGKTYVWIYTGDATSGVVNAREITVKEMLKDGTAIVSNGIKEHEQIVTAGVNSIQEGENVKQLNQPSKTNVGGLL